MGAHVDGSGDPFGILATIIPIFILTVFLGETRRLVSSSWADTAFSWLVVAWFGFGEGGALFGVVFGGPVWLLLVVAFVAICGLLLVLLMAAILMIPQRYHHRPPTELDAR